MIFLASTVAELKATPVVPALTAIVFGEPYELPPAVFPLSPEVLRTRRDGTARPRAPRSRSARSRAGSSSWPKARPAAPSSPPSPRPSASATSGWEPAPRTSRDGRSRATRPESTRRSAGAGRIEEIKEQEADLMRDREARLGAYRGFALVFSAPYDEGRVETAVRVDFERGSVYNRFLWGPGDSLVGRRPAPSRRLGATSPSRIATSWPFGSAGAAPNSAAHRSRPTATRRRSSSPAPTAPCACRACPDERRRQRARLLGGSGSAVSCGSVWPLLIPPKPTGSSSTTASRPATPRPARTSTRRCSPGCARS